MPYKLRTNITKEEILSKLSYDPETGIFTRINTEVRAGCKGKDGYRRIKFGKANWYEHRLAYFLTYGEFPDEVDHINHIKDDNRICNLRGVSKSVNQQNRKGAQSNNKSGSKVAGVYFVSQQSKFVVRLMENGKIRQFGSFISLEEAEKRCIELRREKYEGNTH